MQAATIKKIMQIKDDLGIKVFHVQGDNSNFFSHGILGNEILFDFENEMAIAIRVNKSSNITPYRITMLDFEQIQYITFELDYEETLKKVSSTSSIETIANKTGMSYTTATRVINSLVERGYITKQIIPTKIGLRPLFKILDERFELIREEQ